jgi:hypothetical protein
VGTDEVGGYGLRPAASLSGAVKLLKSVSVCLEEIFEKPVGYFPHSLWPLQLAKESEWFYGLPPPDTEPRGKLKILKNCTIWLVGDLKKQQFLKIPPII